MLVNGMLDASVISKSQRTTYLTLWMCRSIIVPEMRAHGIAGLALTREGTGWSDDHVAAEVMDIVHSSFPDSRGLLPAVGTVQDAIQELCYTGPPELLSMWACILCDARAMDSIRGDRFLLRNGRLISADELKAEASFAQLLRNTAGAMPNACCLLVYLAITYSY